MCCKNRKNICVFPQMESQADEVLFSESAGGENIAPCRPVVVIATTRHQGFEGIAVDVAGGQETGRTRREQLRPCCARTSSWLPPFSEVIITWRRPAILGLVHLLLTYKGPFKSAFSRPQVAVFGLYNEVIGT